jgi:hypothetical protein
MENNIETGDWSQSPVMQNAARSRATRLRRLQARAYDAARQILATDSISSSKHCYCCHKLLTDSLSVSRGFGVVCWERVLNCIADIKADRYAA